MPQQPTLELRSEVVQEIISQPPRWIVRWGITVFFFVLLLLLTSSYLIRYPDIVKAPFRLVSQNVPKSVQAHTEGKLVRLLVAENEPVHKGQLLGYMESTAAHTQVLALQQYVTVLARLLQTHQLDSIPLLAKATFTHLGEVQTSYQTFQQAYTQLLASLEKGFYPAQKKILYQELADLRALHHALLGQQTLLEQDYALAKAEFEAQQKLYAQRVIAPLELKREESKLLAKRMPVQQLEMSLIANLSAQTAKQKEILALDKTLLEQQSLFVEALHTMQSQLESWKQQHLLVAPQAGKVYFASFLQENQTFTIGQEVFFIGSNQEEGFGEVRISQQNMGKVQLGQLVQIHFNSYPSEEFGSVEGKIAFLSPLAGRDSTFLAKVTLPHGLTTSYHQTLTYKNGMTATAEIITQDSRLLEKLFSNLRKSLKR